MAMPDQQKIMSISNQGILLWYSYKKYYRVHSSDEKLFSNSKNKHELIMLLSNVFTEHGIEVHVATDDADTMVANKVLNLSL
jgi:predicted RNase H-related nuclease YkuK (DUF458 family)